MTRLIKLFATTLATCVAMALGQAAAHGQSNCTLFAPTPKDQMREFNTDRPTKSNVPWTVPCGHFQYEGDFFIYTYDPSSTSDSSARPRSARAWEFTDKISAWSFNSTLPSTSEPSSRVVVKVCDFSGCFCAPKDLADR